MSANYRANVAAGLCGDCRTKRTPDDGGTGTLCKRCGDGRRRTQRARDRLKAGIPLDAPRAPQGRPRASWVDPGPQASS